nr:hypothetical protein B0A51_05581 [Rachicladosporium sp. CCFEE 5018]
MVKRKSGADQVAPSKTKMDIDDENDSGSDDNDSELQIDFEWFDPQPAVDFHGLKNLLRQLFDVDNQLFDLSELTDIILAQPLLGSTVKCDGNESDPFAFLTVLNMSQHREKEVMKQLTAYLTSRAATKASLSVLKDLLAPTSKAQVGLILTERMINMPHQVVPPMYNMLQEELSWALEEKEPYEFTHYLLVAKVYTEVASVLDAEPEPPTPKKQKKKAAAKAAEEEMFYFHPEDEVLQQHALAYGCYEFERQADEGASDAKRAFQELGVRPQGSVILIEAGKFAGAVEAVKEYLGSE